MDENGVLRIKRVSSKAMGFVSVVKRIFSPMPPIRNLLQMSRVNARRVLTQVVQMIVFLQGEKQLVDDLMDQFDFTVPAYLSVARRESMSSPFPATGIRNRDFLSNSLGKSVKFDVHIITPTVAQQCCGGGFFL
jgi:hypothetical protein